MRRTSSVCRVSNPTALQAANTSTLAKRSTSNQPELKTAQINNIHSAESADIPRRESLHKPTWQYKIPGQHPSNAEATASSNAPTQVTVNSDSDDDDDEYLRRPSIVKHHHYYQEKEVQQQLQLPTKPLQQLRRASLHSGVCFKGNTKITRHHTIASADLKVATDNGLPLRRKGSLAHTPRTFGVMIQNSSHHSTTFNTSDDHLSTADFSPTGSMGGVALCRRAGHALMRMVSLGTRTDVLVAHSNNGRTSADGEEAYDMMGKNKIVVVDGTRVKLQIWDTAGQERFRSVTHAYYRDAHALLLLYDVTNKTTYDNIRAWLGEIREYAQDDVVIVLIGNKADCSNSERQVKREDGERLAREHNVPFMETSAKTGLNVELAFSAVARQLKCRGTINGDDGKFNVHDFVRDNTKARTMCAQCKSM